MQVFVKNTFIDIEDQEGANAPPSSGARRRAASAPPSLHGGCMASFEDSKSDGEASTQVCEEVSSLCGSGTGSEADTSYLSHCQGSYGATRLKSSARAWQPNWGQELSVDDDSTVTRLKSSAKAWQPNFGQAEEVSCDFDQEVAHAVSWTQAALARTGLVTTEMARTCQGYEIKVSMLGGPEAALRFEGLLTLAKQSLLNWAETASSSTYVLGYSGRPFQLGVGCFVAQLAAMEDPDNACWDSYRWGCCTRGGLCRWQHPKQVIPIAVRVEMGHTWVATSGG
eukprot:TRINITY_DN3532_c0_g1_i1.p1 TRINITY_DN3532_c0_g1~~TRINITY_DN3532_c0_g1_i1.p1  ORF type:complete len:282 (+),score=47.43 TRINITY_DN3532_c0_g1_i1:207-1052(+)